MTKLAHKAGNAGIHSTSKTQKLGLFASFMAAAAMTLSILTPGANAFGIPEPSPSPPPPPQQPSITKPANNNFKMTGPVIDPGSEWTIRLAGEVSQASIQPIIDQMRKLNGMDPDHEITLVINSPGGSVTDGLALYDVMQSITNDVRTVCEGEAASMGAVILAGGTPGKRYAYDSCAILIHELSWGTQGKISNMNANILSGNAQNDKLVEVLHKHSGLPKNKLRAAMTVDGWTVNTTEAKEMGLIDHVIPYKPMTPAEKRDLPASFCARPERQRMPLCLPGQ